MITKSTQNQSITKIKEIFSSIQGEGLNVGEKQIFVRFTKCNLHCKYCDTDFMNGENYSTIDLYNILSKNNANTVSFTGGEPLLETDFLYEFLKTYKEKLNKKIYLETNGTLTNNLEKIIDFIDDIALDIKLKSATGQENQFFENEKFLDIARKKHHFIKVVFDENIDNDEIKNVIKLGKKHNSMIILQPKMPLCKNINLEEIFEKFYVEYQKIRLIPQTHKFLNLA